MELFKGQSLLEFTERFKTDLDCEKYLASIDEFTIGGKEEGKQGRSYEAKKKKVLCAIQLSNQGKVKRFLCI